ncbi:hypothetical protein TELCIR_03395 [Teladorsagia circumcincta]|uniref:Uncharacterized protein n=1 Tax=Teladorsagia circumcincta TaxID=45464 RepID=A0A2G9UYM4_TELCI|nr:hypothetical protein TELCIR_03395 [Teladorsagia circumcincta]
MSDEQAYLKQCKYQDHDTKTKRRSLSILESPKRKARTPEDVRTARKFSEIQRDKYSFRQQSMMKLSCRKKVQVPAVKEKSDEKKKASVVKTKKEKNRSGGKHSAIKAKNKSPSTAASQFVAPLPCDDDYTNFEPTDAVSRPARAE